MDLIENDPLYVLDVVRVLIQHLLQDLSCHDDASCIGVQRDISSAYTN